ncbi:hypothetical protein EV1_044037 [Malus domestica]
MAVSMVSAISISEFRKRSCSPDIGYLSPVALRQPSCSPVAAVDPRPRSGSTSSSTSHPPGAGHTRGRLATPLPS